MSLKRSRSEFETQEDQVPMYERPAKRAKQCTSHDSFISDQKTKNSYIRVVDPLVVPKHDTSRMVMAKHNIFMFPSYTDPMFKKAHPYRTIQVPEIIQHIFTFMPGFRFCKSLCINPVQSLYGFFLHRKDRKPYLLVRNVVLQMSILGSSEMKRHLLKIPWKQVSTLHVDLSAVDTQRVHQVLDLLEIIPMPMLSYASLFLNSVKYTQSLSKTRKRHVDSNSVATQQTPAIAPPSSTTTQDTVTVPSQVTLSNQSLQQDVQQQQQQQTPQQAHVTTSRETIENNTVTITDVATGVITGNAADVATGVATGVATTTNNAVNTGSQNPSLPRLSTQSEFLLPGMVSVMVPTNDVSQGTKLCGFLDLRCGDFFKKLKRYDGCFDCDTIELAFDEDESWMQSHVSDSEQEDNEDDDASEDLAQQQQDFPVSDNHDDDEEDLDDTFDVDEQFDRDESCVILEEPALIMHRLPQIDSLRTFALQEGRNYQCSTLCLNRYYSLDSLLWNIQTIVCLDMDTLIIPHGTAIYAFCLKLKTCLPRLRELGIRDIVKEKTNDELEKCSNEQMHDFLRHVLNDNETLRSLCIDRKEDIAWNLQGIQNTTLCELSLCNLVLTTSNASVLLRMTNLSCVEFVFYQKSNERLSIHGTDVVYPWGNLFTIWKFFAILSMHPTIVHWRIGMNKFYAAMYNTINTISQIKMQQGKPFSRSFYTLKPCRALKDFEALQFMVEYPRSL